MRFGWLAGAAAGGCEMSMAVWALGLDRDYVYAVAKKASAWLPPFFCLLAGVYAGVFF